jgi:hypothetical protein
VSRCYCDALAEFVALSDDPREETRLRRTSFGVEVQRWRLASTIFVPDGSDGAPACDSDRLGGAIPRAVSADEPTIENLVTGRSPARQPAHDHS